MFVSREFCIPIFIDFGYRCGLDTVNGSESFTKKKKNIYTTAYVRMKVSSIAEYFRIGNLTACKILGRGIAEL